MTDVTRLIPESPATARIATDLFAPAVFEYLFLRPRHLQDAPVVAHLPLLFWICASLRPRDAAVVGAGDGTVQFALCQAIERLGTHGRCTGYGFWHGQGVEDVGCSIPTRLVRHQETFYEETSRLLAASDPDRLADALSPASLDLLWLDLAAAADGLALRAELFLRALRPSGMMFLHGTGLVAEDSPDGTALRRLRAGRRCVSFDDEQGLLMLPGGDGVPPRIAGLLAAAEAERLPPEVERVFRRVGQGLLAGIRLAESDAARAEAEARASEADQARETAESTLRSLTSAYDLRNRTLAEIQSALFDARVTVADLKSRIAEIEAERASERLKQVETVADLRRQIESLHERLEESETARASLAAAHESSAKAAIEQNEALRSEVENLREGLRLAEQQCHAAVRAVQGEREARASEAAEFARMSADLRGQITSAAARIEELTAALQAADSQSRNQLEALRAETENLRESLSAAEQERLAAVKAAEEERVARFSETAALARIAEDLRGQLTQAEARQGELAANLESARKLLRETEAKLKGEIAEERRLRFRETAALTRMLEEMRAKAARKPRRIEEWMVARFVGNERKLRKYRKDRVAFFADSRFMLARAYLRLRPGP